MIRLTILYNNEKLKTYELADPVITVGRLPENTISIANMGISRRHLRIERDAERNYVLCDLNSLNATFVNNTKVKNARLQDGDKISIGKYSILFEILEQSQSESASGIDTGLNVPGEDSRIADGEDVIGEDMEILDGGGDEEGAPVAGEEAAEETPALGSVLIETNKHVVYKLDKPHITLGSSENDDIFVSGFLVGSEHAAIEVKDDGAWIRAKRIMGKFRVNGRKTKMHRLAHKDRIEIGSSTFRFMENE